MPAIDAFTAKQSVWEGLHDTRWGMFAESFLESYNVSQRDTGGTPIYAEPSEMTRALATTLQLSETFYVSPEMHAVVTAAAEEFPEDETVQPEDFPTDHGFLMIPGAGIVCLDVRGAVLHTNALSWSRRGDRVWVTMWADKRWDEVLRQRNPEAWEKSMLQWSPWHLHTITLGQPLPKTLQMGKAIPPEISSLIQYKQTEQGFVMWSPEGWDQEEMKPSVKTDSVLAWLVAALRIMQQPLADVREQGVPAQVRKNLMRKPIRLKQKRVTVIEFRRTESACREVGSGREFSHRFLRRGHWRRQPYKREDGSWDRRRIWIHPTVVGPADKPFIMRDHVNALMR